MVRRNITDGPASGKQVFWDVSIALEEV